MCRLFRRLNLSSKLVLLVFTCFVCIYVLLNIFWAGVLERKPREEFISSGTDICTLGNQMVEKECSYLQGIAAYLSVSSKTQKLLLSHRENAPVSSDDRLADELASLKYPVSVVFYDLEGMPVDAMSIDASKYPVRQSPTVDSPFARVLHGNDTYEWEFIEAGSQRLFRQDNSPKLCLWRLITDTKTTQPLGMIAIAVDTRRIISMGPTHESPYFQLLLLDQKSALEAFNHSDYALDAATRRELIALGSEAPSGNTLFTYRGKRYHLFFARSGATPLICYYITPYSLFVQDFDAYWVYFIAVLVFLTLALFPLLRYSFRRMTMPLHRLTVTVDGFARGDMQASFEYEGEDEIGKLGRAFNEMVQTNRAILKKMVELHTREREAELNALQAQINPHFLYNMLNMIYWRALRSGNDELADISYAMSRLFRMTLKRDRTMISLREEFEICSYYMMLQKKRFGDHVEYQIKREAGLDDVIVPKLLLQPLVENAIIHGAENYTGVVHIRLTANRDGDTVVFRVMNDGSVIPENILRLLPNCPVPNASPRSGNGMALHNIAERLQLLFGDAYVFTFESSEENGTIVTIAFPIHSVNTDPEGGTANA